MDDGVNFVTVSSYYGAGFNVHTNTRTQYLSFTPPGLAVERPLFQNKNKSSSVNFNRRWQWLTQFYQLVRILDHPLSNYKIYWCIPIPPVFFFYYNLHDNSKIKNWLKIIQYRWWKNNRILRFYLMPHSNSFHKQFNTVFIFSKSTTFGYFFIT